MIDEDGFIGDGVFIDLRDHIGNDGHRVGRAGDDDRVGAFVGGGVDGRLTPRTAATAISTAAAWTAAAWTTAATEAAASTAVTTASTTEAASASAKAASSAA